MLVASLEFLGVVFAGLLVGCWALKGIIRKKVAWRDLEKDRMDLDSSSRSHMNQHRALVFLMSQKTDAVLAALANTIEQERQKLGLVVRNPSIIDTIDACDTNATDPAGTRPSSYDQILPMARQGIAPSTIARQLKLPEAEVAMVMRLNAA
jgi:hypothetical protein